MIKEKVNNQVEQVQSPGVLMPCDTSFELQQEILNGSRFDRWGITNGSIGFKKEMAVGKNWVEMQGIILDDNLILGQIITNQLGVRPLQLLPEFVVNLAIIPSDQDVDMGRFFDFLPQLEDDFSELDSEQINWKWGSFLEFTSQLVDRLSGVQRQRGLLRVRQRRDRACDTFEQRLARARSDQSKQKAVEVFGKIFEELHERESQLREEPLPVGVLSGDVRSVCEILDQGDGWLCQALTEIGSGGVKRLER